MAFTYAVSGASPNKTLAIEASASVSLTIVGGNVRLSQDGFSTYSEVGTLTDFGSLPVSVTWGGVAGANVVVLAAAFADSNFAGKFSDGAILEVNGTSSGVSLLYADALKVIANGAINNLVLTNTEFGTQITSAERVLLDQKLSSQAGEQATIDGSTSASGVTIDAGLYSSSFILKGSSLGDTIIGGSGADSIFGDSGADSIIGGAGADTITGGSGDDTITGGAGVDTFNVYDHTDTITDLGNGQDILVVTSGDEAKATVTTSWTATSATSNGGKVTLNLDDGVGVDLTGITAGTGFTVSAIEGNTAGSYVRASQYGDTVTGSSLADELRGYNGNDSIYGDSGNDTIFGGSGNDTISGGVGADNITVDWGTDTITDLGIGQDVLVVTSGATATATVVTSWTATSSTSNNGTVTIDLGNGVGVNLIDAAGTSGFKIDFDGNTAGSYVRASANADTIVGSSVADELRGYNGNDSIYGSSGNDTIYGGDGNDTLTGGSNADRLDGGAGADTFVIDSGTDTIADLGNGQDILKVNNGQTVTATVATSWTATASTENVAGVVTLDLDSGVNLDLTGVTGGSAYTITAAGNTAGSSFVRGSIGGDTITGSSLADELRGFSGDDTINGGAGNDIIFGGQNNDSITGGAGADTITVDWGTDTITDLGNGQDSLVVTGGAVATATVATSWTATSATKNSSIGTVTLDLENGVAVNLTAATGDQGFTITASGNTGSGSYVRASANADIITGSSLADELRGYNGNDSIDGSSGNDTIFGGLGNDTIIGGSGADTITVDWGTDTITDIGANGEQDVLVVTSGAVANATVVTSWIATTATSNTGGDANLTLNNTVDINLNAASGTSGFDITMLGANAHTVTGSSLADNITGFSADDTIYGGAGNDVITGGAGNDSISGGSGADTINVDAGEDTIIDLGNGSDILVVSADATAIATVGTSWTATSATTNDGTATLELKSNVDVNLVNAGGSAGFTIDALNNGNSEGSFIRGSANADTITGSSLADELRGFDGNDVINGSGGRDDIWGGVGADTLDGGTGADIFHYDSVATGITLSTADVIQNFSVADDLISTGIAGLTSSQVSIADGTSMDFDSFSSAARDAFALGKDVYVAYNVGGNALVAINNNDGVTFNQGDSLIKLVGVNEAADILVSNFIA